MTISDDYARRAMRQYYYPFGDDPRIISGESGAAGLGALLALTNHRKATEWREQLGLTPTSKVLLLNTEGDTDPVNFREVIGENNRVS